MTPPPRRILMTLDAVGGVWRYALDAAAALNACDVAVVLTGLGPRPTADQEEEAARLLPLTRLTWLDEPLDWMVEDESALGSVADAIADTACSSGVDLVHLNLPSQAAGLASFVPVVAVSHSCVATWWAAVRGGPLPPSWAWQQTRTMAGLRRADLVLVPSRSHAAAIEACYGPLDAVRVVLNAAQPSEAEPDKLPYVIAAARWWDEGKNARALDEAAAHISWPVLAAGATEGPGGAAVAFRHVRPQGSIPAAEARRLIGRAAIVISPSIYEPFGLVVLEGAAAGAALVLSDIPTYRELWEGAALFAPPNDPAAFAAALNTLVADPKRRRALGREAAARAAVLTPQRQAEALLAAYAAASAPQLAAAE